MSGQAASYYNPDRGFGSAPQQQPAYNYNNGPYQNAPYQNAPDVEIKPTPPPQEPPTYNQAAYGFDEAFKIEKPKFNDLRAGIMLIAVFQGYAANSGITIHSYTTNKSFAGNTIYDSPNAIFLNTNTLLFLFVLAVALVFSWAYFLGARYFPKFFIWATGILNIVLALATGIYYIVKHQYGGGITFLIFVLFAGICFVSWIPRVPFTACMLRLVMDVAKRDSRGRVFIVSALGGLVSLALAAWFAVTLVAMYIAYEPGHPGSRFCGVWSGLQSRACMYVS